MNPQLLEQALPVVLVALPLALLVALPLALLVALPKSEFPLPRHLMLRGMPWPRLWLLPRRQNLLPLKPARCRQIHLPPVRG